jgi:hypothetical protein
MAHTLCPCLKTFDLKKMVKKIQHLPVLGRLAGTGFP